MTLARWPNEGFVQVVDVPVKDGHTIHGLEGSKTGRLIYEGERPARWKDEPAVLLYGYWFAMTLLPVPGRGIGALLLDDPSASLAA